MILEKYYVRGKICFICIEIYICNIDIKYLCLVLNRILK